MLSWDTYLKRWVLKFENVKRESMTSLGLRSSRPTGSRFTSTAARGILQMVKEPRQKAETSRCGQRNQQDWRVALDVIRLKLGKYVGTIPISDRFVTAP